jgi:hypothetical protein
MEKMKKLVPGLLSLIFFSITLLTSFFSRAQTTVTTIPTFTPNNGSGMVTFNFQNTNAYDIIITGVSTVLNSTALSEATLWTRPTPISSSPGGISTANGWTAAASQIFTPTIGNSSTQEPVLTNISVTIPANTTVGMAVGVFGSPGATPGRMRYYTTPSTPATYTFSAGGVNLISGNNIGYGYTSATTTSPINLRSFVGSITFVPAVPCTSPPTAGTATVSNTSPCAGISVNLGLTGNSGGTGQTYQWESAPSSSGPWTSISSSAATPAFSTVPLPATTTYYHALVTCGASTVPSLPVAVTVNAAFPGGIYTINASLPASSTNFQSFTAAAAAINCAIAGPVVFNVAPGTYTNDHFWLDSTSGTSASNTITINGNGATLSYTSIDANNRAVVRLNGTDQVSINNLNIIATGTGTQFGFGVQLLNGADSNTITNCTIAVDSVTASTNFGPVVISGSVSSQTTSESNCDGNVFSGNSISGGYYGVVIYGNAAVPLINNNSVINNSIRNFYAYGVYLYGSNGALIEGNDISRPARTNSTTFAGIIFSGLTRNTVVSKNRIHNAFDQMPTSTSSAYAIYSSSSDAILGNENLVVNNLVYNINHAGTLYGIYNVGSDYYKYYHNTISLDDVNSATSSETRGVYQTTAASGLELKNNIISVTRGGTGIKYAIYLNTTTTTGVLNYNDYYVAGAGTNYIGYANATNHSTLSAWQSGTTQDANSVSLPGLFGNAVNNDYTPGNASLDNLGTNLNVTTDILNAARSATTPDLGAYEFSVPTCTGTPNSGNATINGTSIAALCSGGNISLSLQGYSVGAGITYQWESSPSGMNNFTLIAGATNPMYSTTMTGSLDYRASVTCLGNSAYSNIVSATQNPFYFCYCSPLTGTTLQTSYSNYTTNVSIPTTTLNSSTTTYGPGAYTQLDPTIPSNTATLFKGSSYTINATQSSTSTSINTEVWADWDQNGTFDATEYYQLTNVNGVSSTTIAVPATAVTGMTGLRVRTLFSTTVLFGAGGACSNISQGRETEDYVITVSPPPTCWPPTGLTATSVTTSSANINWTASSSNPSSGYDYYFSTSSTAPTSSTVPTGSVTAATVSANIGGLSAGTTYYVWVRANCGGGDYSTWSALPWFATPPPNDECVNAIDITNQQVFNGTTAGATQSMASCDATVTPNDVWYYFTTGTGGSATISVNTTTTLTDIVLSVYSGSCGSLTVLTPTAASGTGSCVDGPAAGNEYGTYTVASNSTYYVRVYGYLGAQGTFPIQLTGIPLSINLSEIKATNLGNRNRIDWKTLSEDAGDIFELQRSRDGQNFASVATIAAKGEASTYSYWDEKPFPGLNHYRLKMSDAAGKTTFSEVVTANMKTGAEFSFEAYPNPVDDLLTIKANGTLGSNAAVTINDATGKLVKFVPISANEVSVDMTGIAKGLYFIKYSDSRQTQTVMINKK